MKPIFVNKFSIITLLIVATATISLMACNANAQSLPEQPSTSGGSDETQTQPIKTPPSSGEETGEVNTGNEGVEPVVEVFEWDLVWSDEFEGTTIDTARWNFEQNCWGGGNNEMQCYTDSSTNAFIENGVLNIVAINEKSTGYSTQDGQPGVSGQEVTREYTSARLTTQEKADWTYGRFEIRAKLPSGQGVWPALSLLSADRPYRVWGTSGEIDILEAINLKAEDENGALENRVHGTVHYRHVRNNKFSGTSYRLPGGTNPADGFHTYALEWEEGEIRWYVDGFHYATHFEEGWYSATSGLDPETGELIWFEGLRDTPFNSDFFFIMNLAVGGNWPEGQNEKGVDSSVFPQTFEIDYVRVYECSAMRRGGGSCATIGDDAVLLPLGTAPEGYAQPVNGDYVVFDDGINPVGIRYNSWNPEGIVSFDEVADPQRGTILTIDKSEDAKGYVYFEAIGSSINMTGWKANGIIEFDYRVNSIGEDVPLLIKIDSGWPDVSDARLPTNTIGEWQSYRIAVSDLTRRYNSLRIGGVSLDAITNVFVIDPVSGPINVSFDNIRFTESKPLPTGYGQPPEYVIFGQDGINTEGDVLRYNSFNSDGAISYTEVEDAERGKILNVSNKMGASESGFFPDGSVFFNSTTPVDLSCWRSDGAIAFDYRVNSADAGVKLLVKVASEYSFGGLDDFYAINVEIPTDSVGDWQSYSIEVSDFLAANSTHPPINFKLREVVNVFVIEPLGVIDVDFANIRYTAPIVEPSYDPDVVLIRYKAPAPVLENEDETGTIYLRGYGGYEATFVNRGLAVVSEDFASVGFDTADLEIFGGEESSNTYYVRFNDDIDPSQLSSQLRAIDRIDWAQPNYHERFRNSVIGSPEPFYAPYDVLIRYKAPVPALENEDEDGTIDLEGYGTYEATFISRGLAAVSEDFASVGFDTADLEIFGGSESRDTYYVRFNADIDPLQLSSKLRTIDRIDWAQPNFIYGIDPPVDICY